MSRNDVIVGLDHVQVAAPHGCEDDARRFYGELLGLEKLPKPALLEARGGRGPGPVRTSSTSA